MAVSKRKRISISVVVSVPAWMTPSQARREVRTLINEGTNYLSCGPDWQQVDEKTVRAVKVMHGDRPHAADAMLAARAEGGAE